ncbi:MAG TPA: IS1634 family transposase [Acidimicrobiales bacterium]|nr:IS1634 family transposase [Acidimicrobiales bacterium]
MYVKVSTVRSGKKTYRYLTLAESYRDEAGRPRSRVVARLGEVSEMTTSGELERIVDALSSQLGRGDRVELSAESAPSFGAMAACEAYFSRLGLDQLFSSIGKRRRSASLPDAVYAMVSNRLSEPSSKRRCVTEWIGAEAAMPEGRELPSLDQLYRALDAVADHKDEIESELYGAVCNLTNLDLRLVCYDLTSTYFEGETASSARFPSRAFGYSRDHRGDRPQVVIGLLVTSDGIPIAHHVFPGNSADVSTLPGVMSDLQERFGVGRIALVADRGLISEENLALIEASGFDHVIATRLHRAPDVRAVLEKAAEEGARFVAVGDDGTTACEVTHDGRRHVVIDSPSRHVRDDARRIELLARTEDRLIALAERVRSGRLVDPAKIGAAADRILRDSGVGRCFVTKISHGRFIWDYDEAALDYEERLLSGRYVITTSLDKKTASVPQVVAHYKSLQAVEWRFRVLKDLLALRPVFHYTERRVRGHVAICVLAAVIEAVMTIDLDRAGLKDPLIPAQPLSARRALHELELIRRISLVDRHGNERFVLTRPSPFQAEILSAADVDTSTWRSRIA